MPLNPKPMPRPEHPDAERNEPPPASESGPATSEIRRRPPGKLVLLNRSWPALT